MSSEELKCGVKRKHVTLTLTNKLKVTEELENGVMSYLYFRAVFCSALDYCLIKWPFTPASLDC
jgi:hypothetical protein